MSDPLRLDIGLCAEDSEGGPCQNPATWLIADCLVDPPENGWHSGRCDRCVQFYAKHLRVTLDNPLVRKLAQAQIYARECERRRRP